MRFSINSGFCLLLNLAFVGNKSWAVCWDWSACSRQGCSPDPTSSQRQARFPERRVWELMLSGRCRWASPFLSFFLHWKGQDLLLVLSSTALNSGLGNTFHRLLKTAICYRFFLQLSFSYATLTQVFLLALLGMIRESIWEMIFPRSLINEVRAQRDADTYSRPHN